MATNIRPLHDRVIVRRIEEGEQVRGGIIIPDTAKEKPQEVKIDGEELLIMREDEILGIIQRAGAASGTTSKKGGK